MSKFLLLYSDTGGGGGGTEPIDPASLSPNNSFDERDRANNSWKCQVTTKTFGDGGAVSFFPFTQNSLEYFETDASFTPLFRYDLTNWFTSGTNSFSFIIVHKTRVVGSTTNKKLFWHTSDDPQATWYLTRNADLKPWYVATDDVGEVLAATGSHVLNDDVWNISIMTVKQAANAAEMFVYQSTGETLSATNASWALSNYNGQQSGTFCTHTGASWTGTAELIFWNNKILTLEEANGIGTWLASKWDIPWTDNT